MPAANNPEIEICIDPPTIISGMLGGIIAPMTALAPVSAAEKAGGYLSRIMAGMRIGPIDAASAKTEPEMPAKNMLVNNIYMSQPTLNPSNE